MKPGQNRIRPALALLLGALIGVILGLFFEPDFRQPALRLKNRTPQE